MPPWKVLSALKGAINQGCHLSVVWRELQGHGMVLTQMLLCGQAGLFPTEFWYDKHSPEGWEALRGCARWPGSNVCVSCS